MPGPCQRLQDEVDNIEQEIQDLLDALPELPPAARAAVMRQIARLRLQLRALNTQLQAFYNAATPDFGPNWQLRFQLQFLFPR